jgi:hypothetical protein
VTRRNTLRLIYGLGLITYTIYAIWFGWVAMPAYLRDTGMSRIVPPVFQAFFQACSIGGYLQIAGPMAYLTYRPMWWGKLLMLMFLLSGLLCWPMLSVVDQLGAPPTFRRIFVIAALCSGVMSVLAIAQQIVDPSLWRPYKQWGGNYPPPRR